MAHGSEAATGEGHRLNMQLYRYVLGLAEEACPDERFPAADDVSAIQAFLVPLVNTEAQGELSRTGGLEGWDQDFFEKLILQNVRSHMLEQLREPGLSYEFLVEMQRLSELPPARLLKWVKGRATSNHDSASALPAIAEESPADIWESDSEPRLRIRDQARLYGLAIGSLKGKDNEQQSSIKLAFRCLNDMTMQLDLSAQSVFNLLRALQIANTTLRMRRDKRFSPQLNGKLTELLLSCKREFPEVEIQDVAGSIRETANMFLEALDRQSAIEKEAAAQRASEAAARSAMGAEDGLSREHERQLATEAATIERARKGAMDITKKLVDVRSTFAPKDTLNTLAQTYLVELSTDASSGPQEIYNALKAIELANNALSLRLDLTVTVSSYAAAGWFGEGNKLKVGRLGTEMAAIITAFKEQFPGVLEPHSNVLESTVNEILGYQGQPGFQGEPCLQDENGPKAITAVLYAMNNPTVGTGSLLERAMARVDMEDGAASIPSSVDADEATALAATTWFDATSKGPAHPKQAVLGPGGTIRTMG